MFSMLDYILRVPVVVLGHRRVKYSQLIATNNKGNTAMPQSGYLAILHTPYSSIENIIVRMYKSPGF